MALKRISRVSKSFCWLIEVHSCKQLLCLSLYFSCWLLHIKYKTSKSKTVGCISVSLLKTFLFRCLIMTFLLCKFVLTTPIHFLVLHRFRNAFQDYLPLWCEVDQSVVPEVFLLVLLDNGSDICFIPVLTNLFHLHSLSKATRHWPVPSALKSSSCQVPGYV